MAKAMFIGRIIPKNKHITVTVPISMSNTSQTNDGFDALVDLVIATDNIVKLDIIIGAGLYAHYWGDEIAAEQEALWKMDNASSLQKLKVAGKAYQLISWDELTARVDFKKHEETVDHLYQEDQVFAAIVNSLSVEHADRQGTPIQSAINFLLEECAAFLTLDGYIAYPSRNINDALSYAFGKLGKNLEYVPYNISYTKTRALIPQALPSGDQLLATLRQAVIELEKKGITDNNGKIVFFKGFLRLMAQESSMRIEAEHEETAVH